MDDPESELTEQEIEQRREAALKRMLNTPHQPHKTAGKKRKSKPAKSRIRARKK